MTKSVDIIGAGIAGLTLGIYLQKRGFNTTIYEQHSVAGGLCTGWSRKGYTFNGCIHWILGAKPGISFYHFWKELFDIDNIDFYMPNERVVFELPLSNVDGSNVFHFYTDIDRFEQYLCHIAPEDSATIKSWTDKVRMIMPLLDFLPPVFKDNGIVNNFMFRLKLIKLVKILPFMKSWGKLSNKQFAQQFKNPFVRMAVERLYDAPMRMTVVIFAQAYAAKGVAQYPIGGSLDFAQRLAEQYSSLGGKIRLATAVDKIVVNNNTATGLLLTNGSTTKSDFVVSAADWHWTVFDALEGRFVNKALLSLQNPTKDKIFYSYCRLFLGVRLPMTEQPHFSRFLTSPLTLPDGTTYDHLEVEVYNHDHTLAPTGCVTMAVNLLTQEGNWWINLRLNDKTAYDKAKHNVTNMIVDRLTQHYGPQWRDAVEVIDFNTPATYHRYTRNLMGSSQGWMTQDDITRPFPVKQTLPGLRNFLLVGHWTQAGGGIPVSLLSARKASHIIARSLTQNNHKDTISLP